MRSWLVNGKTWGAAALIVAVAVGGLLGQGTSVSAEQRMGETPRIQTTAKAKVKPAPAAKPVAPKQPSPEDFGIRGVLQLDQPLVAGDYAWNDEGVPAGPVRIVVDLANQHLYAYRAGYEIGRSTLIYGADHKPTPTGIFPITQKDADHRSSTYGGAPMPYMLRLTNDGVSIHGSDVEEEYATHGCVGVPEAFARLLFQQAKLGDFVLITNGWGNGGHA